MPRLHFSQSQKEAPINSFCVQKSTHLLASLSTLAALLMLTSSVSLVTVNDEMMPFLSATCAAGEDMVSVTFDINFKGNNADGDKINGNSKKILTMLEGHVQRRPCPYCVLS
jgi:hypothetical protein